MRSIYLSLGSNIGDRYQTLLSALKLLGERGVKVLGVSKFYETEPQGFTDQDLFLNCAALVQTAMEPIELLRHIHEIEGELDRVRVVRWGPRTIDIDIIWVQGYTSQEEVLTLPHPRAFERAFVVRPLCDLPIDDPLLQSALQEAKSLVEGQGIREFLNEH